MPPPFLVDVAAFLNWKIKKSLIQSRLGATHRFGEKRGARYNKFECAALAVDKTLIWIDHGHEREEQMTYSSSAFK